MQKKNLLKSVALTALCAILLPMFTGCRLNGGPKETVPPKPSAEITLPSSAAPPTTTTTAPPTTTTAPTTTKAKEFFGKVTAEVLNVRAQASKDAEQIGQLHMGDRVQVLGKKDEFYKIKKDDLEGFCAKEYIELLREEVSSSPSGETVTESLEAVGTEKPGTEEAAGH